MPNQPISILSLFCGAGGLDFGFSREQFRTLVAFDNFPAAVASYNLNAKRKTARLLDLANADSRDICKLIDNLHPGITPDGIIGGPPCQGFSRGNVQKDPKDPRNLLPFKYANILAVLNQRYALKFFVFENVMGLLSPKHASRFQLIQQAFRKAGFNIYYKDLDAQDFGVPQLRRRLFIVGLNKELFSSKQFIFPAGRVQKRTVRDAIGGLPQPMFFDRNLKATDIAYHPNHWTMNPRSKKFTNVATSAGRSFRRLEWDDVSPTVAYGNREIHVHPDGGRRLSVHEALLLQGFPQTYRLTGTFSQQITQVSNAVPPPVAQVLARAVLRAIRSNERS